MPVSLNQDQTKSAATEEASAGDAPPSSTFAEIVSLARQSAGCATFYRGMLEKITRYFHSPYAAVHVSRSSEVIQDEWHTGPGDPKFWKASVQQFLTESLTENGARARLLRSKKGGVKVALLSAPICDASDQAIGAIALVLAPVEPEEVTQRLAMLEAMARLGSFAAAFVGTGGTHSGYVAEGGLDGEKRSHQATSRAAKYESVAELAFALCNELNNKLQCEQVSLGLVKRRRVRIAAVSGLDTLARQSPGMVALRGAMEECLDARKPIADHGQGAWSTTDDSASYRLHKQWRSLVHGQSVASIPLMDDDGIVAIASFRRSASQPFEPDELNDDRRMIESFAPAISLLRRAERGLAHHVFDSGAACVEVLLRPGRTVSRILTAVAVVLGSVVAFGSWNYELTVPCILTAAKVRHVVAPFDAGLVSADVVAGDVVRGGQVLCSFKSGDLALQREQLLAERAVLKRRQDRARAEDKPVEVLLAAAEDDLARAKLGIVDRRIAQAVVRAPFDGVVVFGDIREMVGAVLARGDALFQVAPLDDFVLELEVPDASSADLRSDLAGFFATSARPGQTTRFTVVRVLTRSQLRGTRNVFVAQADITDGFDWLRPGMEGVAKIEIGSRPVWWILSHRVSDYLHLHFWL